MNIAIVNFRNRLNVTPGRWNVSGRAKYGWRTESRLLAGAA